ncbi:Lrp/AsnC family transcriptional regulator [Staphylococcus sp. AS1337]|uniref:Lrp/AsnC family transcriptional regulator n=1 Tax=Staphylococcus sp. AS1337 TaxID=3434042 RepID=UPI003F549464
MDITDNKIIDSLKKDSKASLTNISNIVNLSVPSVRERINKMIDNGVIRRYTIDVDYKKIGYDIDVLINITLSNSIYSEFKEFISQQKHVDFCYRISGDSCFIFKARFKEMLDVEEFIDVLKSYGHTETQFIFPSST